MDPSKPISHHYDSVPGPSGLSRVSYQASNPNYANVETSRAAEGSPTNHTDDKPFPSKREKSTNSCCGAKTFLAILCLLESLAILVIGGTLATFIIVNKPLDAQAHTPTPTGQTAFLRTYLNPARSCLELSQAGVTQSNFYNIQPDDDVSSKDQVFCDMETDGGGWTLVASIYDTKSQNNCWFIDPWFSTLLHPISLSVSKNWNNFFTFGNVHAATSSDYKSRGYFNLRGSNLLIRHVSPNSDLRNAKSSTFLEYYTNNSFLENYMGNLCGVYSLNLSSKIDHKASMKSCSCQPSLIVPIHFTNRRNSGMINLPANLTLQSNPGLLHFRSLNNANNIKNVCQPHRFDCCCCLTSPFLCIGNTNNNLSSQCPHKLEWKTSNNEIPTRMMASPAAESTILIFYR